MISLPIDALEIDIVNALKTSSTLILQAPPGSGKTTRVPQFLMRAFQGKIIVLEPRRLAARMSAERISDELGQSCGKSVGFQIRYERMVGPETKTIFMTEGLFLRTLLNDPKLPGVEFIVLDEFHERHMHSDIAYVLTRALQKTTRPDLKLIVMSATLDTEKLLQRIPEAVLLKADVPTFPVEVEYDSSADDRPLEWRVAVAVETLLKDPRCPGDILVFLSGAADIRRAASALAQSKHKSMFDTFELRAELPTNEQKKVFLPHPVRKVILSTNVAETSLTIPGVTGVVDTGVAKVASHAHWNGLPSLDIKPVSQASAIQRAGRAGRTAPGVARRLYTRADFLARAAQEKPEIQRMDLAQVYLELLVASQKIFPESNDAVSTFEWLDPPPPEGLAAAQALLIELEAINSNSQPTTVGEKMVRWPVHPRLGRILEESAKTGTQREACLMVSLLNEGLLFKRGQKDTSVHTDCDLTFQGQTFEKLLHSPETLPKSIRECVDQGQIKRIEKSFESLCHLAGLRKGPLNLYLEHDQDTSPFARELISGFPDRIIALRKNKSSAKSQQEVVFSRGGLGQLSPASTVQDSRFAIALQAEQQRRQGSAHFTTEVTAASGVSGKTIKAMFASRVRNESVVIWDEQSERVRSLERVVFDSLTIDERQIPGEQTTIEQELFNQLKSRWPRPFADEKPLEFYQHRISLLSERFPELQPSDIRGEDFELFLVHICEGKKSFAEISEQTLQDYIDTFIPWELKSILDRELPSRLKLGSGRTVELNYVPGQPPWLSSRMQDFFGTMETPKLLQGSLSVTVHLLAPNGQAVQVTTDLANFWKNTYPDVKKELSRRYPRHYWPDDPKNAEPIIRRLKPGQTPASTSRSK